MNRRDFLIRLGLAVPVVKTVVCFGTGIWRPRMELVSHKWAVSPMTMEKLETKHLKMVRLIEFWGRFQGESLNKPWNEQVHYFVEEVP